jgi:acyl-CoA:6-aminopenicillanic acid acyl transferase
MRSIELSGTRYDMGRAEGETFPHEVRAWHDMVAKRFESRSDAWFHGARRRFCTLTEQVCPYIIEQIRGLADGAGLSFRQAYSMNFYSTLAAHAEETCSNVVFTHTPDGPLLAATIDLPGHEQFPMVAVVERPDDGPAVAGVRFIGLLIVGRGVNEHGVAMGGSSMTCEVPEPAESVNAHVGYAHLQRFGRDTDHVLKMAAEHPVPRWGRNLVVVDATGHAAVLEQSGEQHALRLPEDGAIWCANTPLTDAMRPYRVDNPPVIEESQGRLAAIERLVRGNAPSIDLARRILSHTERPGAVFRHLEGDPLNYRTVLASITCPAQLRVEYDEGGPDQTSWQSITLVDKL